MDKVFVCAATVTVRDVQEILRCSRSTVECLRKTDPDFPKPLRLGKIVRWRASDISTYIDSKAELGGVSHA